MRVMDGQDDDFYYLLTNHLGSVTDVLEPSAQVTPTVVAKVRYLPWGETWEALTDTMPIDQTDFHFTGQREEADIGLYDYKARWYGPQLGRFIQPDTIVPDPGDPQSLNRYTYGLNNPVKFTDPTGHIAIEAGDPTRGYHPETGDYVRIAPGGIEPIGEPASGVWHAEEWTVFNQVIANLGADCLGQIGRTGDGGVALLTFLMDQVWSYYKSAYPRPR
jgi:RHS repeat-associated protein